MKIYVKLLSLSLQKHLLKQKWLFHRNLIFLFVQGAKRWKQRRAVVLFRLFCCTKQTFASFNVDVFRQQGETQLTFQLLALKQKWLFRCNLIFLFVQGAKRWKQRRAVVLFRLFCCTKQTFASFNVDVFRQQGENVKFVDFATFFHIICFIQ